MSNNSKFIAIKNQADSAELELYFLDVIQDEFDFWSGTSISKVQSIIDQVKSYNPTKIVCIIDSVGGECGVGMAIYNYLKMQSAKVEVKVIGLAGSIASVIAMAANKGKLTIAKNAFMMIHKAAGGAVGSSEDIRQMADLIDKYDEQVASIYAQRTGKSVEAIKGLYAEGDYWMSGDEAVAQGFADSVFNESEYKIAARVNDDTIPERVKDVIDPTHKKINTDIKNQFTDMKNYFKEIIASFKGVKITEGSDNQSIVNQLVEALVSPFARMEEEIGNEIGSQIKAQFEIEKAELIKTHKEAIDALTASVKKLEEKDATLEADITNMVGSGSKAKSEDDKKIIGSFN